MRPAHTATGDPIPPALAPHSEVLLKASALQRAIFNSVAFSSIATDALGVIQIFNVGAERMLGYSADEVVNLITPADISDPEEMVARALALSVELERPIAPGFEALAFKASRGIEDIYELTFIRRNGTRFPAVLSVTALRDADELIIGYLLIGTDNTARQRMEEERARLDQQLRIQQLYVEQTLQQKNVELEAASRMKSEFLATVSHELRTPLNAIVGFSEVLRDGLVGELTDQQRGFVGDIFSSGRHLLALINDILDLSKVEAGKMTLDLETVDASSLFENSLIIIRERASARQVRVRVEGDDLGRIRVDSRKVKQILYNLLSNAVKFTVEGGAVTLTARRVPRGAVGRLSDAPAARTFPLPESAFEEFLEIVVADTGIGISPEGLAALFRPFSQIESSLARRFEGTGLGLALVKLMTELHGGTVGVESTVGAGSRFIVWLPARPEEEGADAPLMPAPPVASVSGARIALMVEDDPKAADLIRVQLEAQGFTVLHAASAEAALAIEARQPLSLITLDIMLPNMDGWELLGRLKQTPDLRSVPVVIISIVANRQRGFALGAAAVLQKPLLRHELYGALTDLGLLPAVLAHPLTVLIVADDPDAVELMALRILGENTTVRRACGGLEAIATAQRELPDVIVLDLMMSGVNGFDVVEALRTRPDTASIPIMVVTAQRITDEDRARLNGYVTSIVERAEFDRDRFAAEVRRAMSGREAA